MLVEEGCNSQVLLRDTTTLCFLNVLLKNYHKNSMKKKLFSARCFGAQV